MSETHLFEVDATLNDQEQGDGVLTLATGPVKYGVPPQLKGAPGQSSPEELQLAALCACYSITLGFVLQGRKIEVDSIELSSEGTLERKNGKLLLTKITLKTRIAIPNKTDSTEETVAKAVERAEQACVISNAIRGNVELSVEPEVV